MDLYIVGPKREFRKDTPIDWQKHLQSVEGVRITGGQPKRLYVQATAGVIGRVRQVLGDKYHIEKLVHHDTN